MTPKQKQWQRRNHILWRVKGFALPVWSDVLTSRECDILMKIKNLVEEFNAQTRESSEELGFHTHKRCPICGRAIKENEEYCKKCIEE